MVYAVLSLVTFVLGLVFLLGAAATGNVVLRLIRSGTPAAREAFEHGDNLKNWWKAQAPDGFKPQGLRDRCSLAGRYDKEIGVYAVEERASQPTYMR